MSFTHVINPAHHPLVPNVTDVKVKAGNGSVVIGMQGARGGNRPDTVITREVAAKLIAELAHNLATSD